MDLSSILAEAKGEKAPARKPTPKVNSTTAPKREAVRATSTVSPASRVAKCAPAKHPSLAVNALTPRSPTPARKREAVKATSTASPAFRVEKRAVAKYPTPFVKALTARLSTPAQSSPRPEDAVPRRPLSKPATIVYDTNQSARPFGVDIAEFLAPHPLAVKQAAEREARDKAAQEAGVQQQARLQRRQASRRRQPVASKSERQNAPRRQQRQALELPKPYKSKEERQPKRQSKSSYENMSQRDLHNEAQFRKLELDADYKMYLVEVLVLNDKAYFELMKMLGNHFEAVDFALGEVKQHNKELRQQRAAAAKAAAEKTKRERAEARAAQQQAAREAHKKKKRQEEREKTGKLAPKKREVEKKTAELKQAVEAPKQEQKRKRKESQNIDDSGYFSKSPSPAETGENNDVALAKGKKRARSNEDDDEDKTPAKKAKSSRSSQPPVAPRAIKLKRALAALPHAIQTGTNKTSSDKDNDVKMSHEDDLDVAVSAKPAKKTTKKTTQVNAPTTVPPQAGKRQTRSTCVVEDVEDEYTEGEDEEVEGDDAFIVDDGWKPTRKSRLNAREKSRLFAGMR